MIKMKPISRDINIVPAYNVKLMRSLFISIFLYACESWTLTEKIDKRAQTSEMRCPDTQVVDFMLLWLLAVGSIGYDITELLLG